MSKDEFGEINCYLRSHLNWKIRTFSDLPSHSGSRIWSPIFSANNKHVKFTSAPANWCFLVDKKWVHLSLTSETNDKPPVDCIRVGIVNESGKEVNICNCQWNSYYERFDGINLIQEEQLTLRQRGAIQNGYLRLFCEIPPKPCRQLSDALTKKELENGLEKFSQNFRDLFNKKRDSDLTIKVQDRVFFVHRIILRARSLEFDEMISHKLREDNKNTIEIDFDPEVFREFLLFIYSGKTENITSDNACGLYYMADKYSLPELKHVCTVFLKNNLSFDNICEVISLARKYSETEILKLAMYYFAKNMDQILDTTNWLLFLKDNSTEANEVCIEALKLGFTKKRPVSLN